MRQSISSGLTALTHIYHHRQHIHELRETSPGQGEGVYTRGISTLIPRLTHANYVYISLGMKLGGSVDGTTLRYVQLVCLSDVHLLKVVQKFHCILLMPSITIVQTGCVKLHGLTLPQMPEITQRVALI